MTPNTLEAPPEGIVPDDVTIPEPETQSPYGPRNEKLPKQLVDGITQAIRKAQNEDRYIRRLEVLHAAKGRFYERGYQHLYEYRNDCWALCVPGGTYGGDDGESWDEYIDDYPVIHAVLWIIQSVLTQNGPGVKFEPNNPSIDEDNQAATTADGLRRQFDRVNDVKRLMREIVRMFALDSRCVLYTLREASAAKWGRDDAGHPVKESTARVYGTLETKVPILEKCQDTFPYLGIYTDRDIRNLKQDFPEIRDEIKGNQTNLDENEYERFARLGVLQGARSQYQATQSIAHLTTQGDWWLRPSCFADQEYDEPFIESDQEEPESLREAYARIFAGPDGFQGIHAVYAGNTYAQAWTECMDDALQTRSPFIDDGQYGKAILDPAMIIQDRLNDWMNYIAETFDFGAPSTWVYAQASDWEAFRDQKAMPYGLRQFKQMATATNAVADNFYREPDPNIPATLNDAIQFFFGDFLQFVTATPPAVWGESTPDTKTASGLAQSRNQAIGRLGIVWAVIQDMMARMYYQGALAASLDPDTPEEIIIPVSGGPNVNVRIERLRKGKFRCTPDEDSGFPDSTMAKRATLTQLLTLATQFPPAAQQLFSAPQNWKTMLEILGFAELVIPEAEASDKQTQEIEELLNGVPVLPTPQEVQAAEMQAQMAADQALTMGMPPPPPFDPASLITSSVPVNPWDFDQWEMEKCDDWLNSDACRQELKVGRIMPGSQEPQPNFRGVQNVWLHREEHRKAMLAKMPPAPPVPVVAPKAHGGGKPAGAPPLPASQPAGSPGTASV